MIQQALWFCSIFLSCSFFLFEASDPLPLLISRRKKKLGRGKVQRRGNYGDWGHGEESEPGEHLGKETTLIFQENQ